MKHSLGGQTLKKIDIAEELKYIDKIKELNTEKTLFYYILTMGCQLNENDSEKLCGMLEKMNYTKTDNMNEADLVLFNTCCVRENAEEKLFGKLRRSKENKRAKRNHYCNWWLHDARGTHYR